MPFPFSIGSPDPAGEHRDDTPDSPRRERRDAFNEARKATFIAALIKTGCLTDAARAAGVTPKIYNHQESDPGFARNVETALAMSATPVEMIAWRRAVHGVEQEFACGGQVHVRRRYSDHLLRLLLQGSNPKKFGPNPGFRRKRVYRHERKEIEREIRAKIKAEIAAQTPDIEDVRADILRKVGAMQRRSTAAKLANGWSQTPSGYLIPPGYGPLPGLDLAELGTEWQDEEEIGSRAGRDHEADTPRDSVRKS